jgi:hypothetical protein
MKKQWLIVVVLGITFSGVIAAVIFFWPKGHKTESISQNATAEPSASPTVKLVTWDDPAGFTFEYPEGIDINKHDENTTDYAQVEMTSKDHPGTVTVWAKDIPFVRGSAITTVSDWVSSEAAFKDANQIDTVLGDQNAKKILLTSTTPKTIVGTLFDGLLWYVEGSYENSDYWKDAYGKVTKSFTFKPTNSPKTAVNSTSSGDSAPADEEETLE